MEIRELLDRTTRIYRPEAATSSEGVAEGVTSTTVWLGTPHEDEAPEDDPSRPVVDVHFFKCEVGRPEAEALRDEFYRIMDAWPPDPTYQPENRLQRGPSYIELGVQIGTFMGQQDAMRLMALGEVLGVWEVVTPEKLLGDALEPGKADQLAGMGFVMITGYKKPT